MTSSRRQFLATLGRAASAAALAPLTARVAGRSRDAGGGPLRLAVVAAGEDSDYGRGALFGIEEAEHAAGLLRRPLDFLRMPAAAPTGVDAAGEGVAGGAEAAIPAGVDAMVAALGDARQAALEGSAAGRGIVVVDARAVRPGRASGTDTGTGAAGVFRTGLPAQAYASAEAATGAGPDARAVLWHGGLFRYGAEQLNDRYLRRFDREMTGEAWAAWIAVKAVAEAAFRTRSPDPAGLREALGGPRAAFDGHKGSPLTFTAPGGTLAQPFYVLAGGETRESTWPMEEGR